MSGWTLIAVIIGVLLVACAGGAGALFGWQAYRRSVLMNLVVRAEAVEAAGSALIDTITRLSEESDEALEHFCVDREAVERRALHEIVSRAGMLADELDRMPLPASLVSVATALADAAYLISREAALVTDEQTGSDALDALSAMDLALVRAYISKGRAVLFTTCEICGLDDTAVYGGGLYL